MNGNETNAMDFGAPLATAAAQWQRRWNHLMRWIRRLHLYSGLMLLPWVLLYGITAFLFNHSQLLGSATDLRLERGDLDAHWPTAANFAAALLAEYEGKPGSAKIKLRLVDPERASFGRGLGGMAELDGKPSQVQVNLERGTVVVRPRSQERAKPMPGWGEPLLLPHASNPTKHLEKQLPKELKERGAVLKGLRWQGQPELTFHVESGGKRWEARYALLSETLMLRELPPAREESFLLWLCRLHTAHGYPSEMGPRWWWAVLVDTMFVAMVFWRLSGLFMWWQLKALRLFGAVAVLMGLGAALWLFLAMHAAMTN